jgi:S-adenosylmethionine decarboxylase proenzyme
MPLARHTLLELHDCPRALLANSEALRPLLLEAVRAAGATVVTEIFHNFSPHGVSGVIVIAESHVAIHTWPEHGYAAVDIFSCDPALDQAAMSDGIAKSLGAQRVESQSINRGQEGAQ